jgi:sporulation protein YlmC with PRC-barrel domain
MHQKQHQSSITYIGDLLRCKIVTAEGKRLGHVADVQLSTGPEYRIIALLYGELGWLHRLHLLNPVGPRGPRKPKMVPWEAIDRIEGATVILQPGYMTRSRKKAENIATSTVAGKKKDEL